MYINCEIVDNSVYVWERHPDGRRLVTYPSPWNCYVQDPRGQHKTLHGETASFFEFDTRFELMGAIKASISRGKKVYEGDIPPDLKILSEHYYEAQIPDLHIGYLDIEVDYKTNSYEREHIVTVRKKGSTQEMEVAIGKIRDASDKTDYEIMEPRGQGWISAEMSEYMYCGPTGFASIDNPYAELS